jgi:hypothetical protein
LLTHMFGLMHPTGTSLENALANYRSDCVRMSVL